MVLLCTIACARGQSENRLARVTVYAAWNSLRYENTSWLCATECGPVFAETSLPNSLWHLESSAKKGMVQRKSALFAGRSDVVLCWFSERCLHMVLLSRSRQYITAGCQAGPPAVMGPLMDNVGLAHHEIIDGQRQSKPIPGKGTQSQATKQGYEGPDRKPGKKKREQESGGKQRNVICREQRQI